MAITLLILFAVSWLAAAISGIAGFAGALLLLPIISHYIGIKAAIPVCLLLLNYLAMLPAFGLVAKNFNGILSFGFG